MSERPESEDQEFLREPLPEAPSLSEYDERIDQVAARARAARVEREKHEAKVKQESAFDRDTARGAGVGMTIAYAIIGVPLVGFGIGYLVDMAANTGNAFRLIGVMLGMAAAIFFAVRTSSRA